MQTDRSGQFEKIFEYSSRFFMSWPNVSDNLIFMEVGG